MKIIRNSSINMIVGLLIVVFLFQPVLEASVSDPINMSFKEADLRDIFRTIAELSEVNLITDTEIRDRITINLSDISFEQALDVLTKSSRLAYKKDGNVVVVSTPERLEEIYNSLALQVMKIEYAALDDIKTIINGIYPGLNIQLDNKNRQIILQGMETRVSEARKLVSLIDIQSERHDYMRIIKLNDIKQEHALGALDSFFPGLQMVRVDSSMVIRGARDTVEEAVHLMAELDLLFDGTRQVEKPDLRREISFVKLEYSDVQKTAGLIRSVFPEINIQEDIRNSQLIMVDSREETKEVLNFIKKIDVPLPPEEKAEEQEIEITTVTRMIDLENMIAGEEIEKVNLLYPELLLVVIQDTLVINGEQELVSQAADFVQEIKEKAALRAEQEAILAEEERQKELETLAALEAQREKEREAELAEAVLEEKQVKIYQIDHVNAENLYQMITSVHRDIDLTLDGANNRLIFNDTARKIKAAEQLIQELNVPQKQVIIEARIEEISRTDLKRIGVDPDDLSQINFIQDAGSLISGVELTLPSFLKVLRDQGKSQTLASPRLMTLNGEEAKLLIGDQVPILLERVEDGQVVTSIEYIEAGITLEFIPWVTDEDEIILEVAPKVSTLGQSAGPGGLPSVNTREAETKIRLQDGQMIAIGGLIQQEEIENISRIPLISDIPILGHLFKYQRLQNRETELLILITPTVVKKDMQIESRPRDLSGEVQIDELVIDRNEASITDLGAEDGMALFAEEKHERDNYRKAQEVGIVLLLAGIIYSLIN